ncbi:MAG: hypothetical protein ACOWWH_05330 [Eubacteriaceae bacterium]
MENGVIRKKRKKLGKLIGIKSDYIVVDAIINGEISMLDELDSRTITMPINYKENLLKGSINLKEKFKYPDPLFPYLELKSVVY